MGYQAVFRRYEMKYMLTRGQKEILMREMEPHMVPDQYGKTTIRNLYFDTEDYRMIRRSIEKPVYKEKLRIRSYSQARADSTVFVELKKKYDAVVYKRRVSMTEAEATAWVSGQAQGKTDTQICREVDYFLKFYGSLKPAVFLSYDREAYCDKAAGNFRVTFDENIFVRQVAMSLQEPAWGTPILENDQVLMEIKSSGGIPVWLTRALSRGHIYKTSFSKYGTAYQTLIYPNAKEHSRYV